MTGTAPHEMKEKDPKTSPSSHPKDGKKSSKHYVILALGGVLALAAAYIYKKGGKEELMNITRETLLSLQSLRDYGAVGYVAFIFAFVTMLTLCLPGTMAWVPGIEALSSTLLLVLVEHCVITSFLGIFGSFDHHSS
eukprot:s1949_g8.t1